MNFEDAHVVHNGGELYPAEYQVARFLFRGGWLLRSGDSLSFLSRGGNARLEYQAAKPVLVEAGGRAYHLPATGPWYAAQTFFVPQGRVTLRCVDGAINLDRLTFESPQPDTD